MPVALVWGLPFCYGIETIPIATFTFNTLKIKHQYHVYVLNYSIHYDIRLYPSALSSTRLD